MEKKEMRSARGLAIKELEAQSSAMLLPDRIVMRVVERAVNLTGPAGRRYVRRHYPWIYRFVW